MARMHSGARGKAGSKRPPSKAVPEWVEVSAKDVEELVVNLTNQGKSSAEIGMILRDTHGIPRVKNITGKSITDIQKENELLPEIPEDLLNLIKKSVELKKHLSENKKDYKAQRGDQLTISKIRRLVKYYTTNGRLPKSWRFSEETAALLVK